MQAEKNEAVSFFFFNKHTKKIIHVFFFFSFLSFETQESQAAEAETEVSTFRKSLEAHTSTYRSLHSRWVGIDAHIAQLKNQRHDLLENAKRKGVTLPQQGESEEVQVETQGKRTKMNDRK